MDRLPADIKGLTDAEVATARQQFGTNEMTVHQRGNWIAILLDLLKEPMLLLLVAASVIYFVTSQVSEGIFMISAIVMVTAISFYQEARSRNALESLRKLSQPQSKVVRDGMIQLIDSASIVVGDVLVVEEGTSINADACIIYSNDFSVNESILTGESMPVQKSNAAGNDRLYHGTYAGSGIAMARVTQVGDQTELGKIGASIMAIKESATPLQQQISRFVKKMAIFGAVVFVLVWMVNYLAQQPHDLLGSLLKALTLAMSILPEEIPVAFTTFMAMGAWRLMKLGIIVKKTKTVETLGSATVLCTDKTGTITENRMELAAVYVAENDEQMEWATGSHAHAARLMRIAMFASEPLPFDPMEKALHAAYAGDAVDDERTSFTMVKEYPLAGRPPMMTHIFESKDGKRIIACKGAPEKILQVCRVESDRLQRIQQQLTVLTSKGYRVLGVAESLYKGNEWLPDQEAYPFGFAGLVAFYDPPKQNISKVLADLYTAGIKVKIITGDTAATTQTIAGQIDFQGGDQAIDGEALMRLSGAAFDEKVMQVNVFTRMFPEAKLAIVESLKRQQQIVAMTGDGVNDAPALKAAHIGIAMGDKGTEVAKDAAEMILKNDDLALIVTAIAMGRKIYNNLKKAIQYIISIHIPIILTVVIPLILGWRFPNIFTPVHVIFLELIMGPTCSIIYEHEPMEQNTMLQPPRSTTNDFLNWKELNLSVLQGLAITIANLAMYQYALYLQYNVDQTRAMVFITLITANVLLTLVNRSFFYSVFTTMRYRNTLLPVILFITLLMMVLILSIPMVRSFFSFQLPSLSAILICILSALLAVGWIEVYKWVKRNQSTLDAVPNKGL